MVRQHHRLNGLEFEQAGRQERTEEPGALRGKDLRKRKQELAWWSSG